MYGRWGSTGTVCRTSKNCFQGYDGVRIFFRQNIVNSGLTGELPVEKVRQMIDQQRFDLTFILQPQHGSQGLAISHSNMTRRGNGLGTTMRYSYGIFFMANRLPPDMRSFRSFSFKVCAYSRTPTCNARDTVFGAPYTSISK